MGFYGSALDNGQCSYSEWRSATCPICGKRYRHTVQHVYRAGDKLCCSYGCQRRYEREAAEKQHNRAKFTRPEGATLKQKVTRCKHRMETAKLACEAPNFCTLPEGDQTRMRATLNYWAQKLEKAQAALDAWSGTN